MAYCLYNIGFPADGVSKPCYVVLQDLVMLIYPDVSVTGTPERVFLTDTLLRTDPTHRYMQHLLLFPPEEMCADLRNIVEEFARKHKFPIYKARIFEGWGKLHRDCIPMLAVRPGEMFYPAYGPELPALIEDIEGVSSETPVKTMSDEVAEPTVPDIDAEQALVEVHEETIYVPADNVSDDTSSRSRYGEDVESEDCHTDGASVDEVVAVAVDSDFRDRLNRRHDFSDCSAELIRFGSMTVPDIATLITVAAAVAMTRRSGALMYEKTLPLLLRRADSVSMEIWKSLLREMARFLDTDTDARLMVKRVIASGDPSRVWFIDPPIPLQVSCLLYHGCWKIYADSVFDEEHVHHLCFCDVDRRALVSRTMAATFFVLSEMPVGVYPDITRVKLFRVMEDHAYDSVVDDYQLLFDRYPNLRVVEYCTPFVDDVLGTAISVANLSNILN